MDLVEKIKHLYGEFGQQKPMGQAAPNPRTPHYFVLRSFMGENDLAVILNTKRCRYQCNFCQLPAKSSKTWIAGEDILAQFEYIVTEVKHALSIVDRVSLSNEGSVLDTDTLPTETLLMIARCINELRRCRTLLLETRLEFVDPSVIRQIKEIAPRVKIQILTGFETQDTYIKDKVLYKREPLDKFLEGLDRVAKSKSELMSYVLYKPSPTMTDEEAFVEAEKTFDFLKEQCLRKELPLSIRFNPMYIARGSKLAQLVATIPDYKPPRLTDMMRLAEQKAQEGFKIYIGLSTEGLHEPGLSYHSREDYSPKLIRPIKLFNDGKITHFDWEALTR